MSACNNPLLVLDLDETLIHATVKGLDREPDFQVSYFDVYKRPHLATFLEFAGTRFKVGIWSSAEDGYVDEIAKEIIPKGLTFEFVWGGSTCDIQQEAESGEFHAVKPARKLIAKGHDPNRILMVDDSPEKLTG